MSIKFEKTYFITFKIPLALKDAKPRNFLHFLHITVLFFFLNLHTTVFFKTHVKFKFHLQNSTSIVLRRPTIVPSCILLFFVSFKNPPLLLFLLHLQRPTKFQCIVDFPCFHLLHFNPPLLLFLQKPTKPTKLGLSLLLLLQGINFSIFI